MRRAIVLAGCLSAVSCADNILSGSLSEVFPLDVSTTSIAANGDALQVTYLVNRGVFVDVVARVSVAVSDLALAPGLKVSLAGQGPDGVRRCVVSHAPGGEPVRVMPPIERGDLVLSEGGRAGEFTRGNFSVLFASEGGDVGFGRTLTGTFAGLASDDHAGTAALATGLVMNDWATSGGLQFTGDQDLFTFSVNPNALAVRLEATGGPTRLRIELMSGEAVSCVVPPASEPQGCEFVGPGAFSFRLPSAGKYILRVSEAPEATLGSYAVRVLD